MTPGQRDPGAIEIAVKEDECTDAGQGVAEDERLLEEAARSGRPQLRLWYNAPCLVVGRGYARKMPHPVERVFNLPVLVRSSGGEVVIHGPGVLNVSLAVPDAVWSGRIGEAFAGLSAPVAQALRGLGFAADVGPVPNAYCPGDHDVAVAGRKVMGISQRRRRGATLVHGSLNVAVVSELAAYLINSFYRAAGLEAQARAERIGTLYDHPLSAAERARLHAALIDATLDYWTERLGRRWVRAAASYKTTARIL